MYTKKNVFIQLLPFADLRWVLGLQQWTGSHGSNIPLGVGKEDKVQVNQ